MEIKESSRLIFYFLFSIFYLLLKRISQMTNMTNDK